MRRTNVGTMVWTVAAPAGLWMAVTASTALTAQRTDVFLESRDHPAIAYSTAPTENVVTSLDARLQRGDASLTFDAESGYLLALLQALGLSVESQTLVFSPTSFQAAKINRANPRAVFFNDRVAVGFVRGGDILEIAAQDPRQGTVFYTLAQSPSERPRLKRDNACLACHLSWDTRGVPGTFALSVQPRRSDNDYANGGPVDHRAPFAERWGGWYVTGTRVPSSLANVELLQPKMPETGPRPVPARATLAGAFDLRGYPSQHSDVVALMVLDHQVHATNLITRAGWEHRVGSPNRAAAIDELVDYLLFVGEARFLQPIQGSSTFPEVFAALGPRDRQGRSLREFDLRQRLFRYPLSYMIYSPGFTGLPEEVRRDVRSRLDAVLSGKNADRKYAHLALTDRRAIREILADTF